MVIETVIKDTANEPAHIQHRPRIPAGLDRNRLHANEMVESRTPEAANKYRQKADGSVAVDAKFMHLLYVPDELDEHTTKTATMGRSVGS